MNAKPARCCSSTEVRTQATLLGRRQRVLEPPISSSLKTTLSTEALRPVACLRAGPEIAGQRDDSWFASTRSPCRLDREEHATGHSGDDRGCRAEEVYGNLYQFGSGQPTNGVNYDMVDMGNGGALAWGNSAPGILKNVFLTDVTRKDNTTYAQSAPPAGWGYCGTDFNGTGSAWDQNSVTSTGYACLDQPGRGPGDLLSYNSAGPGSGSFPQKCNLTQNPGCTIFTGQWPRQPLEPMYFWNNNASPASGWGGAFFSDGSGGRLTSNVDYYPAASGIQTSPSSPFNGKSGTGWGTLANRPSTCTTGVGYFATDQGNWNTSTSNPYGVNQSGASGVLYTCTPQGTWTTYYMPYTYPHPLTQGDPSAPVAPTGLTALVKSS